MSLPDRNQTVFLRKRGDTTPHIQGFPGLHIGWHSGTRWHSYMCGAINDDADVEAWEPINTTLVQYVR